MKYLPSNKRQSAGTLFLSIALYLFYCSTSAYAGMHLSISGAQSTTHANLQTTSNSSQSIGVSFDLFQILRLGYTHRLKTATTQGSREGTEAPPFDFFEFRNITEERKQSIDMTVVPFATRILIPFIFGGIAQKTYVYRIRDEEINDGLEYQVKISPGDKNSAGETINPEWGWNAGIGIRIPLNKDFSIKVTQTWSEGRSQKPGQESKEVNDTYTEYGISYRL